MSLKLIQILIIFLNLKNPVILGKQFDNVTLTPPPLVPQPRVVGGYRVEPHTLAKYIVSLRYSFETEKTFGYTHFCGGSIIEANKILTAAHCVYVKNILKRPSTIQVVAKTPIRLKATKDTEVINVKEIVFHADYNEKTFFNDIAVLILEKDIQLDGKMAAKIALPRNNIQPGKICTVIGWGQMYMYGPLANNMLYADLSLYSRRKCRRKLPHISGKKVCASNDHDQEVDVCKGDSGGPLICQNSHDELTGIVSYGYGCAVGKPGVYTNVYKYLDWIETGRSSRLEPVSNILWLSVIVGFCIVP